MNDVITIQDLEVFFHVGVPDEERARPQRLLISIAMEHDFTAAASGDDLSDTLDYFAVSERVRQFGDGAHWKLIETLALDLTQMVIDEFGARRVMVEVKKFVIPQTAHVSVRATRARE
jgi:FolB domain-containing protein